jgi:hypothetical protein
VNVSQRHLEGASAERSGVPGMALRGTALEVTGFPDAGGWDETAGVTRLGATAPAETLPA